MTPTFGAEYSTGDLDSPLADSAVMVHSVQGGVGGSRCPCVSRLPPVSFYRVRLILERMSAHRVRDSHIPLSISE